MYDCICDVMSVVMRGAVNVMRKNGLRSADNDNDMDGEDRDG